MSASFVFPPQPLPSLPIAGRTDRFPVRRVFCVGLNYADHTREMGGDPAKTRPMFFTKPADAVVPEGGALPYPPATDDLHYEVELVVALKSGGMGIPEARALDHVYGYAVGIDLTRRDLQKEAKAAGAPWDAAKGLDLGAPVGVLSPMESLNGHLSAGPIRLSVNGQARQDGDLSQMIWSPAAIIHHLSGLWTLQPGDLIFTGTPSGVGACKAGDRLTAMVAGLAPLDVHLTKGA